MADFEKRTGFTLTGAEIEKFTKHLEAREKAVPIYFRLLVHLTSNAPATFVRFNEQLL